MAINSLILLLSALVFLLIIAVIVLLRKNTVSGQPDFNRIDALIRDEFSRNREEINSSSRSSREELGNSIKNLSDANTQSLKNFEERFSGSVREYGELQRQKFEELSSRHDALKKETELKLDKIKETVEKKLESIQQDNSAKLEQMRQTVDEKLHNTLEKRLGESFKIVSERLEQVHKGLGEMQNLAVGVGDLKKVLSNVKSRGIMGEIQLGAILDNMLSPSQYERNVYTKDDSREQVEFAIKLPGRDDEGPPVYLPVDSKFPIESYYELLAAYDSGDPEKIKTASKSIENDIKKCAKDIREKYLNPPDTTDFGLLFLPTEGLYAEIVRRTELLEILQREYKVIITGPSTLAALLNSLQIGFKTLAIEKRSSEVWKILSAVKTEFGKFEDVLKKAQEKINKASEDIDHLVGARTRKIKSTLKTVQELPPAEGYAVLLDAASDDDSENV